MRARGFSLIELLIIMAIIFIIMSIASSMLSQARKAAQESKAVANLRGLASAEYIYYTRNNLQYTDLATLRAQGYTAYNLPGSIDGYDYTENVAVPGIPAGMSTTPPNGFGFGAKPSSRRQGDYDFAVATDGVLRYWQTAPPGFSPGDPLER